VLSGNHVLDVMDEFAMALVKATVFATLCSPLAHEPPGFGIHC
jgi:hypothetical protein